MTDETDAYYKLKQEYAEKNGPFSAIAGLPAEKRTAHKCLRCRKPGGNVFIEDNSVLRVECGADQKCDINVTVNKQGQVILMPDLLRALQKKTEEVKTSLIELKIKHAIGSITDDDVIQRFDASREALRRLSLAAATVDGQMLTVTDSPQKHADVNRLKAEIYTATQEFKSNLQEFTATGREAYLVDALEHQDNVIMPLVTELRDTLYAKSNVEYDADNGDFILIQDTYTLKDMEVNLLPEWRELL